MKRERKFPKGRQQPYRTRGPSATLCGCRRTALVVGCLPCLRTKRATKKPFVASASGVVRTHKTPIGPAAHRALQHGSAAGDCTRMRCAKMHACTRGMRAKAGHEGFCTVAGGWGRGVGVYCHPAHDGRTSAGTAPNRTPFGARAPLRPDCKARPATALPTDRSASTNLALPSDSMHGTGRYGTR